MASLSPSALPYTVTTIPTLTAEVTASIATPSFYQQQVTFSTTVTAVDGSVPVGVSIS